MKTRKELFIEFNNLGFEIQGLRGNFQNEMEFTISDLDEFELLADSLKNKLQLLIAESALFITMHQSKTI